MFANVLIQWSQDLKFGLIQWTRPIRENFMMIHFFSYEEDEDKEGL